MARERHGVRHALPTAIRQHIARYLRGRSSVAEGGWTSSPTSEDALTGDFGGSLRTEWSDLIEEGGYFWRWRVTYRKLGAGNQHSSEEKPTGSDGVFQLEVKRSKVAVLPVTSEVVSIENVEQEYEFRKGILFQSKRYDASDTGKLLEEVGKIERLTPGEGVYFEYGPKQYRAALAKDLVQANGAVSQVPPDRFYRIGDFLADQFMECVVGVEGLYVDLNADPQVLHFPETNPAIQDLGVRLGHALTVHVTAFRMVRFAKE